MTREDGIELPCGRGGLNEPQPLALAVGDLLLTVHDACAKHELLPLYEKLQANAQRSGERIASAYLSRLPADEQGTETATRNATTLGFIPLALVAVQSAELLNDLGMIAKVATRESPVSKTDELQSQLVEKLGSIVGQQQARIMAKQICDHVAAGFHEGRGPRPGP